MRLGSEIQKQLQTTDSGTVEEVLHRLLETQEEQDRWLQENRDAIEAKSAAGWISSTGAKEFRRTSSKLTWRNSKPSLNEGALRSRARGGAGLVRIWRYINKQSNAAIADRVEWVIRRRSLFGGETRQGHWRKDLIDEAVKFFPVYSYLIAYRPDT